MASLSNQPNRLAAAPEAVLDDRVSEPPVKPDVGTTAYARTEPAVTQGEVPLQLLEVPPEILEITAEISRTDSHPKATLPTSAQVPVEPMVDRDVETNWNKKTNELTAHHIDDIFAIPDFSERTQSPVTPLSLPLPLPPSGNVGTLGETGNILQSAELGVNATKPLAIKIPTVDYERRSPQLDTNNFEQTLANAGYGDTAAQFRLDSMNLWAMTTEQRKCILPVFLESAYQGNIRSQRRVGEMFLKGQLVSQNYKAAVFWLTQAADQGDSEAQILLSTLYSNGQAVVMNDTKAEEWLMKAAGRGNLEAQYRLGRHYEDCLYSRRDVTNALKWYEIAASRGHSQAQERAAGLRRLIKQQKRKDYFYGPPWRP